MGFNHSKTSRGSDVMNANIKKAFWLPGLAHLALGPAENWSDLKHAMIRAGESARSVKPDVYIVYSAQWISVLGHSFQMDPRPTGVHVDENWYDLGNFNFSFPVDVALTQRVMHFAEQAGLATKGVNYPGFPIDTGSLVFQHFFNPNGDIPVVILSSNIYCGKDDSMALGRAVSQALADSKQRAVLACVSSLSNRFITEDILPADDRLSSEKEDEWNQKMLTLLQAADYEQALKLSESYAKEASPEMMFKAFYWLMGVLDGLDGKVSIDSISSTSSATSIPPAFLHHYGPLWGTGAAVLEWQC
jgi:2-aminophenol/2-amino-5-chlorophenol 1,6-dioxygenase subunit alpha